MKRIHRIPEIFTQYHSIMVSISGTVFNVYLRIRLISGQYLKLLVQFSRVDREPCCIIPNINTTLSKVLQYDKEEIVQYLVEISEVKDTKLSVLEYRNLQLKSLNNTKKWRRLFDQLTDTDILYSKVVNSNTVKFILTGDEVTLMDNGDWSICQKKNNFGYGLSTKNIYKVKYQVTI